MKPITITKMSKMIGRSRDLLGDWKNNYPALFEIVQLGCEAKLKRNNARNPQNQPRLHRCGLALIPPRRVDRQPT